MGLGKLFSIQFYPFVWQLSSKHLNISKEYPYYLSMKHLAGLFLSTLSFGFAASILFIHDAHSPATIANDPLNPFPWADAAEAENSEAKFLEAVKRGPNVPPILIRAANFYVSQNDYEKSRPYLKRILELSQAYNGIIFNYYLRSGVPPAALVPEDPRQFRAFLYFLMAQRHPDSTQVWDKLVAAKALDSDISRDWINHQFELRHYQQAADTWKKLSPPKKPSILDWRFSPHDHVQISRDPITLRFDGTFNSSFANITRNYVLSPGKYSLKVDWESERITTNEGPFVQVLDQVTPALVGTTPRHTDHLEFVVSPSVGFAPVTIIRRPSQKFDNKIQGTLIVHSIAIERQ